MNRKLFTILSLASAAHLAHAGSTTLLSSTFENGTNGSSIAGTSFTGGTVGTTWQSDASGSTFTYSNAQNNGGTMSGLLSRTSSSGYGDFWGDLNGGNDLSYTAGETIVGSADFFLPASGSNSTNGALFGLEGYEAGGLYGSVYLYGGTSYGNIVAVGDPDGSDLYEATDSSGNALAYTKGAWNTLSMHFDYTADTVTQSFYLNGSELYGLDTNNDPVPLTFEFDAADGAIGVSDIDVATEYITASRGSAYVDNYSVIAITPAPEPATFAALGLGALAFVRRRKSARS